MLTNKNTIHFLNNSNYNSNFKSYSFFNNYRNILLNNNNNLNNNNFCIDNGRNS